MPSIINGSDNFETSYELTATHDFTADADYTLTSEQNGYGRLVLTDTTTVLTLARNVIVNDISKGLHVTNNTAQDITVKTSAGTGVLVYAGKSATLFNDGVNVIYVISGVESDGKNQCTAWVNFDGVAVTIRDSFNVSSVVRDAVGLYTITFTKAMVTTNYTIAGCGNQTGGDGALYATTIVPDTPSLYLLTGSVKVGASNLDSNDYVDGEYMFVSFYGGK